MKKKCVARGYFDVLKTILDRDDRFYARLVFDVVPHLISLHHSPLHFHLKIIRVTNHP